MATATIAEELKDKTREELLEACFQVQLELRILKAQKAGEQAPERLAFATEKFKGKLDNTAREEIIRWYSQACKLIDDMKKAEDSETPPQKKQKGEARLANSGLVRYLGDIVNASLGPFPHVSNAQVLLDLERVRMAREDILSTTEEEDRARRDEEEREYQWRLSENS